MSQQRSTSTGESVSRASSVAASAGVGVVAALIGYLVTYLFAVSEVRSAFGDDVESWKGVAWYFYNAHLVEIEATGDIAGLGGTTTVDLIAQSDTTRVTLLYAVPPVVLLGAGLLLASHFGARDIGEGVIVGAPVTLGYLLVLAVGAVVSETSTESEFLGIEASGSMAPEVLPAILLGGLLFPLVFATTGAILAAVVQSR
ncbi:hypothetical protein [Natrarchaeobaculum sulfurireducens]|uniref:hypothetical protein n=1 Tax=Natrarchaeobaculum sulfurireducens TaxID=2044521 RepID=UPI000E3CB212|nr:hypothetical protein [Natrarchaeobaculum sulfurireducens]